MFMWVKSVGKYFCLNSPLECSDPIIFLLAVLGCHGDGAFRMSPADLSTKYDRQISSRSADSYLSSNQTASPVPSSCPTTCLLLVFHGGSVLGNPPHSANTISSVGGKRRFSKVIFSFLMVFLRVFADASAELSSKKSDITTFRGAFESVMRQHYPYMIGRVAVRLVPCPAMCSEALGIFSRSGSSLNILNYIISSFFVVNFSCFWG